MWKGHPVVVAGLTGSGSLMAVSCVMWITSAPLSGDDGTVLTEYRQNSYREIGTQQLLGEGDAELPGHALEAYHQLRRQLRLLDPEEAVEGALSQPRAFYAQQPEVLQRRRFCVLLP